ncbi:MAG TPA: DNA recombination protein RmuC [Candidatus Paceibacterota bacterium]
MIILYVLVALLVGVVITHYIFRQRKIGESESFVLLQNQINNLVQSLDARLRSSNTETQDTVRHQFAESSKLIKDITTEIATVRETNRQVLGVADQLRSLQNVLQNPKQRGVLGEYYLETVLKNVLPPGAFQLQYKFADGETADAVIVLSKNKLLSVDSKFSLENYNRIISTNDQLERERLEKLFKQDLKNRIDETAKYIRPGEGTMDFAFMFIPSEAIYYDLLINQVGAVKTSTKDLIEYAFRDKKVIIVSPTSFMAYLQTVLQGMRALQIEETAKDIQKRVEELGRHLLSYDQFMNSLGKALGITVSHYNKASHEFAKIDKDMLRITGSAPSGRQRIEREILDPPNLPD